MEDIRFIETPKDTVDNEVSVHRAFMYSIAMPGWGESYGGSKKRSVVTYSILATTLFIFFFSLYKIMIAASAYFRAMRGNPDTGFWDFFLTPALLLFLGAGGLYVLWMWAMLSSVEVAVKTRSEEGLPQQRSPFWSILMTYFCPGAGHLYLGKKEQGYILCGLSILATFLILPSLAELSEAVSAMMSEFSGPMAGSSISADSLTSMQKITSKMAGGSTYVTLGFGSILAMVIQIYALADITVNISERFVANLEKVKEREQGVSAK